MTMEYVGCNRDCSRTVLTMSEETALYAARKPEWTLVDLALVENEGGAATGWKGVRMNIASAFIQWSIIKRIGVDMGLNRR